MERSNKADSGGDRLGAVNLPIYMDNHATTPVDPRVLDEMLPYFGARFGNAASKSHEFGWIAEEAVERARQQVAKLIGSNSDGASFDGISSTRSDRPIARPMVSTCSACVNDCGPVTMYSAPA